AALESELATLESEREERLRAERSALEEQRAAAERRRDELAAVVEQRREELAAAERAGEAARASRMEAEGRLEAARRGAAAPGAERLLDVVTPPPDLRSLAERLLADAWLVPSLDELPNGFAGIAVTRSGRVLFASTGELRQAASGSGERVFEERNRRERLVAA